MKIFITGTDTNIGKTVVASWLCMHTDYEYFKPIQTGFNGLDDDFSIVSKLFPNRIHKPTYSYPEAVSPHLAAKWHGEKIDIKNITLPKSENILVEGIGGVLVPLNEDYFVADLIKYLKIPVILIASSRVGTINHTLLSLEILREKEIEILGVIVNGEPNLDNCDAIELYGKIKVLAQVPYLEFFDKENLQKIHFSNELNDIFKLKYV